MRVAGHVVVLAGLILAGCGTSQGGGPSPGPSTRTQPTAAPTATATPVPTAIATPVPTPTAMSSPTPAPKGPVILESVVYPYRITVLASQAVLVPALVAWNGDEVLQRVARTVDRVRVDGTGTAWFVVSPDPQEDVDAFVAEMVAKYGSWHGCTEPTQTREFTAAGMAGISYVQSCAGASERFARAIVVGDGHGILAFGEADVDPSGVQDRLISYLDGLEWTSP